MQSINPRQSLLHCLFVMVIMTVMILPLGATSAQAAQLAQTVPGVCIGGGGNPVVPRYFLGKALILNFNHPLNATQTEVCIATKKPGGSVSYSTEPCPLMNNIHDVEVGDGSASFDGNFWIECPAGLLQSVDTNDFYVYGIASILTVQPATYHLVVHPDLAASATFTSSSPSTLTAELSGQYNAQGFLHGQTFSSPTMPHEVRMASQLNAGNILLSINGNSQSTTGLNHNFTYDSNEPIRIGQSTEPWVLQFLIIDPPEGYSG